MQQILSDQKSFQSIQTDGQAIRTVLVVDDSRLQRRILASSLKKWGLDVHEAESGIDALRLCKDVQPDLVLSDWMMPGMNGVEFCRAIRAMPRDS